MRLFIAAVSGTCASLSFSIHLLMYCLKEANHNQCRLVFVLFHFYGIEPQVQRSCEWAMNGGFKSVLLVKHVERYTLCNDTERGCKRHLPWSKIYFEKAGQEGPCSLMWKPCVSKHVQVTCVVGLSEEGRRKERKGREHVPRPLPQFPLFLPLSPLPSLPSLLMPTTQASKHTV